MTAEQRSEIDFFIKEEVLKFHKKKLQKLQKLEFGNILNRQNLYLFKTKDLLTANFSLTAGQLMKDIIDSYMLSSEEKTFNDFLKKVAIKLSEIVEGGRKSATNAADLEIDRDGIRHLINIKSGPNWGNSSQIKKMLENFRTARKVLQTSNARINVRFINGCCYGIDNRPEKDEYTKLCGQRFWEFISGENDFYIEIIEPLGHQAKRCSGLFDELYIRKVNIFTGVFIDRFVDNGLINWEKLISQTSGAR